MIDDERQQHLFTLWGALTGAELIEWIEQQPDKDELYRLVVEVEKSLNRWKVTPLLQRPEDV